MPHQLRLLGSTMLGKHVLQAMSTKGRGSFLFAFGIHEQVRLSATPNVQTQLATPLPGSQDQKSVSMLSIPWPGTIPPPSLTSELQGLIQPYSHRH